MVLPTSGGVFVHRGQTAGILPGAERVDAFSHRAVVVGQLALGVRRELQADLVPAVDQDVRVVVVLLGDVRHPVHERDRRHEVLELVVADQRLALLPPY